MTDIEAVRYSMLMRGIFNQFQRVYRMYDAGLLDDETWSFFACEAAGLFETPGATAHFAGNRLPEDFLAALAPHRDPDCAPDMRLGRPRE